jgi:hypothetical protein
MGRFVIVSNKTPEGRTQAAVHWLNLSKKQADTMDITFTDLLLYIPSFR